MARRAAPGNLLYPAVCLIVGHVAGYTSSHAPTFFSLVVALLMLAALRVYLTVRFEELYRSRPGSWKWLFGSALAATLLIWTGLSCRILLDHGLAGVAYFALLASVIMASLSITTYTASRPMIAVFLSILVAPHVIVLIYLGTPSALSIALMASVYGGYLWTAGRRLNAGYL